MAAHAVLDATIAPGSILHLVDCHVHINDPVFKDDLEAVLQRAQQNGVKTIIAVSQDLQGAEEILHLSEQYPMIKPCAGLHPIPVDKCATREDLEKVRAFITNNHDRLVGIGECGLDFQPWVTPGEHHKTDQRWILEQQIMLSRQYDLPLNIHSRSAGRPTIDVLKQHNARQVVLHAFDGSSRFIRAAVDAGYYFSVPACVTRSVPFQHLVELVPLHQLLLETDSPALAPIKGPGQRNEPMNALLSCQEIARIKSLPVEQVASMTTQNAQKLFPKIV